MKILIFDLETMPMLSYHWQRWQENISPVQTVSEGYLASWAAKWLDEDRIMYDGLNNYSSSMVDEKHVAGTLHSLMSEADVIVHYNGDSFDIKVAQTAFAKYNFDPIHKLHSIDLFKTVKKNFRLSSKKLNSVCDFLGLELKEENSGWKLWIDCVNKDKDAWDRMESYNRQDVVVTEQLYKRLLPWIHNHPNVNILKDSEEVKCCNCGSDNVIKKGKEFTKAGVYQRYKCNDCGTPQRGKTMINPREQRSALTTK